MEENSRRPIWLGVYWGIALLVLGIFFTLFTFGQLKPYEQQLIWTTTLLLGIMGLILIAYMVWRPQRWWYLIPGFLLLSLAVAVYLGTQVGIKGNLLAAVVFSGLAVAYLFIFLTNRHERWWAWISSGSFFLLIAALLWGNAFSPPVLGTLLFLGMGLVFLLMYLFLPKTMQRWWALLLGATFIVVAGLVFSISVGSNSWAGRLWPLLMIALGVAVTAWSLVRLFSRPPRRQVPVTPPHTPSAGTGVAGGAPEGAVITVPEQVPERQKPAEPTISHAPEEGVNSPSADEEPPASSQ